MSGLGFSIQHLITNGLNDALIVLDAGYSQQNSTDNPFQKEASQNKIAMLSSQATANSLAGLTGPALGLLEDAGVASDRQDGGHGFIAAIGALAPSALQKLAKPNLLGGAASTSH